MESLNPKIPMIEIVGSSNVSAIGFTRTAIVGDYYPDDINKHQLIQVVRVQFKSEKVYDYLRVPYKIYNELLTSESKGAYLNKNIIHKYPTVPRELVE